MLKTCDKKVAVLLLQAERARIRTDTNNEEVAALMLHKSKDSAAHRTAGITDRAESMSSLEAYGREAYRDYAEHTLDVRRVCAHLDIA